MVINYPSDTPYSQVDLLGIAVCQPQAEQNHIAILFKPDADEDDTLLLHVGAHKSSLIEKPDDKSYLWLDLTSSLNPIRKEIILASVQQIAEVNKNSKVRYGLDHGVYCLDPETGRLNDKYDETIGFTCATFVIEVFLATGIKLIDWDTWPSGEDKHTKFQQDIFSYLSHLNGKSPEIVTLEYLKAQKENIGKSRFLPQEIAVSTQEVKPSIKSEIDDKASEIHTRLCANFAQMNS